MTEFGGASWLITLPDGWQGENEPDCDALFRPGGAGALQVSAYRKDEPVSDHDLLDFASEYLEAGAMIRATSAGEFVGHALAYNTDDTSWRLWFVRADTLMLFITYNCPVVDRGREDRDVDAILGSLRLR